MAIFNMQQEGRGLKNPEAVKAKQKRREDIERKADSAAGSGDTPLKVQSPLIKVLCDVTSLCFPQWTVD